MVQVIERNNHLSSVLTNWNHEGVSHVGLLGIKRRISPLGDYYTYTKILGRTDLRIIEVKVYCDIDGKKHAINSYSHYLDPFNPVAFDSLKLSGKHLLVGIVTDWFNDYKEEIKIQIHYVYWFKALSFSAIRIDQLLELLMSYRYDDKEAEEMYNTFKTQSLK
jgi:hypothetical protein